MAEDDRDRIRKRAGEGRVAARRRGVKFGLKPKLTDHQQRIALDALAEGRSNRDVARQFNVSAMTINLIK